MSFRRRRQIIGGPGSQRLPTLNHTRSSRVPSSSFQRRPGRPVKSKQAHPGIRPSPISSILCTSTGSNDIDSILGHQGLPLGSAALIEEDGATDFSTSLIKRFLSQGVIHSRLQKTTYCIVIGMSHEWASNLPGIDRGDSKQRKKNALEQRRRTLNVTNVLDQRSNVPEMKIAWRYGLQRKKLDSVKDAEMDVETQYPDYSTKLDITTPLIPAANPDEISCISFDDETTYNDILSQVTSIISAHPHSLIRIALPLFMNPLLYVNESMLVPQNALRFLYKLKAIIHRNNDRVVMMASINLDLYPRTNPLITLIESSLVDAVLELRPFDSDLRKYLERVYRKEPMKVKHGHLNIYKIPQLSELGLMKVSEMELCFKNGKKRFQVEQWSIPIDEEETKDEDVHTTAAQNASPSSSTSISPSAKLDF